MLIISIINIDENLNSFKVNFTSLEETDLNPSFSLIISRAADLNFAEQASIFIKSIFLLNNYCSFKKPLNLK